MLNHNSDNGNTDGYSDAVSVAIYLMDNSDMATLDQIAEYLEQCSEEEIKSNLYNCALNLTKEKLLAYFNSAETRVVKVTDPEAGTSIEIFTSLDQLVKTWKDWAEVAEKIWNLKIGESFMGGFWDEIGFERLK